MSDELLEAFSNWIVEFENAPWADDRHVILDWPAFHARGIELAKRLKKEVGAEFRVIYSKPVEEFAYIRGELREILDNGSVLPLPSSPELLGWPLARLLSGIVSGGQAGADRAALDWAMEHGYKAGGWCPKGRVAEDGMIDARYPLRETESAGYRRRTRLNVRDSDGTLIVNLGGLDGGTRATQAFAVQTGKPNLLVQLDADDAADAPATAIAWLRRNCIMTLNVAGPRESRRPGIYRLTRELLNAVAAASR